MTSPFYYSRIFQIFYDVGMKYSIVRSGDISRSGDSLLVVTDMNNRYIDLNIRKNKFQLFAGGKKSYLCIRLLEKANKITATGADHSLYFWNKFTGKKSFQFTHDHIVTNVFYNDNETRCASLCHKGSFLLVNLKTMKKILFLKHFSESLWISNTFAFNFEKMYFLGKVKDNNQAKLMNVENRRLIMNISNKRPFKHYLYQSKRKRYVMANNQDLHLINAFSLKYERRVPVSQKFSGSLYSIGSCRNDRIILLGSSSGSLMGYDVEKKVVCFLFSQIGSVFHFRLCANERYVVTSGEKSHPLRVWDVQGTIDHFAKEYLLEEESK